MAPSDRTDGPCDRTAALVGPLDLTASPLLVSIRPFLFFLIIHEGLCWFSPRDTSLDLAGHNQTANLDAGRLDGRFESHHRLGGWAKRLVMSQEARVAKGHELPRVVCDVPWAVCSVHTGRPWVSVSKHRTSVCVRQHTQDICGCPN